MKKNVCIIGPLPPPINGNTKALDTILKSDKCNEVFNVYPVNLSGSQVGMSGKFKLQKVKTLKNALRVLKHIQKKNRISTYYLTIAQSTFGSFRDVVLLRQILKKADNAQIVLHLHGGGFSNFYKKSNVIIKTLIKKYYSKADSFIVLSDSLKSMFDEIVDKGKISVIENCVDNQFILSDSIIDNKLSNLKSKNSIQIVYLSNMIKSKGYLDLLYSTRILAEKKVNCKVTFAGNFVTQEHKEQFFNYIKENNLQNYIEYLGVVNGDDKKSLLLEGDIFILPTFYPQEGQPISILEAMSVGMAIITTRHGGIPDVINEEKNGVFIEAQDIQDIAESIIRLVNEPELIKKMGDNNRQKVMGKYLETHYINNIIKALE
ncbi:glycosyltransferase family 4 protein [Virgibacillus sp. JSM 102003]|uniref:glycosyltransferase family 4 protein n=1 Tax=Virgibacillus sp. JSM 102003 TaxID=1562108 RepID=UPI0035BF4460